MSREEQLKALDIEIRRSKNKIKFLEEQLGLDALSVMKIDPNEFQHTTAKNISTPSTSCPAAAPRI
jgi:hypothetical protein